MLVLKHCRAPEDEEKLNRYQSTFTMHNMEAGKKKTTTKDSRTPTCSSAFKNVNPFFSRAGIASSSTSKTLQVINART